jgi:hypothetical protein
MVERMLNCVGISRIETAWGYRELGRVEDV